MVSARLKEFIFKKLYSDLSCVEIITYEDYIWFIDREKKYWYFRYGKSDGKLLWRYSFFEYFFRFFTIDNSEYTSVLSSWVEEVLNHKVNKVLSNRFGQRVDVEDVLNCTVSKTKRWNSPRNMEVEDVLNHKVTATSPDGLNIPDEIEEVLNHKVITTSPAPLALIEAVNIILNHKVTETDCCKLFTKDEITSILNDE